MTRSPGRCSRVADREIAAAYCRLNYSEREVVGCWLTTRVELGDRGERGLQEGPEIGRES